MKITAAGFVTGLIILFFSGSSMAGDYSAVSIVKPKNGAWVTNPVEICMDVFGLEVEPAKKGVHEGKGHHHLLVDVDIPAGPGLARPLQKDSRYIHLGDGSSCKTLNLATGDRKITALFAKGDHVPYNPPISSTIEIKVYCPGHLGSFHGECP